MQQRVSGPDEAELRVAERELLGTPVTKAPNNGECTAAAKQKSICCHVNKHDCC